MPCESGGLSQGAATLGPAVGGGDRPDYKRSFQAL